MSTLTATGVQVHYGDQRVLGPLDLDLEEGSWTVLVGPNGAGKSTLLRALAGLLPAEGTVCLGGEALGTSRRAVARRVAFLPQRPILPAGMRVADYVLLGRSPHLGPLAREGVGDLAALDAVLERLGLDAFAERTLEALSGGEAQRVVLARALAQDAPLLLLDEPTAALDLGQAQRVLDLVEQLRAERGLTVLAAMHDLSLAASYADSLVVLRAGGVVASGAPGSVLTEATIAEHYGATVEVRLGPDARPRVSPRRSSAAAFGAEEGRVLG